MRAKLAAYWYGKTVLITGASSGLGAAITEALAPYGVHFGLLSRRVEEMQTLAGKHKNSGSTFWINACDVRNREEVLAAVRAFHQHAGRLDAVWVNSGVGGDTSFRRWNYEKMENMIDTNLKGAIYTIMASLEIMVPQNSGAIIGICSAASMRGIGARGVYSLTKIGLTYFMESMAVELPQIQFTTIHPGFVDTPLNRGNPNRMWLMMPEPAAQLMIKAVARRKRVFLYPGQMKIFYRLVRLLPTRLYRWLGHKALDLGRPKG
ncbi:MAG: SDR family NAD(P)-dependent oxidoreductase [candidate division KSB1 bacterium]